MKRLIVGLLLGALCCMLFTTPIYPLKDDPTRPPMPYAPPPGHNSGSDDTGWDIPDRGSEPDEDSSRSFQVTPLWDQGLFLMSLWDLLYDKLIKNERKSLERRNGTDDATDSSGDRILNPR